MDNARGERTITEEKAYYFVFGSNILDNKFEIRNGNETSIWRLSTTLRMKNCRIQYNYMSTILTLPIWIVAAISTTNKQITKILLEYHAPYYLVLNQYPVSLFFWVCIYEPIQITIGEQLTRK